MRRRLTLVGGVGQLYQGDLDVARAALAGLRADDFGANVLVEDLSYGAVAVAQRLGELRPDRLILVGAAERGRPPGTVERVPADTIERSPAQVQQSVADAVTGYVGTDLVLDVAHGFGVLPPDTVVVEIEPASTRPSEEFSAEVAAALGDALALVRAEIRRA